MLVGLNARRCRGVGAELVFRVGEEDLRREALGDAWTGDPERTVAIATRKAACKTLVVVAVIVFVCLLFQIVSRSSPV